MQKAVVPYTYLIRHKDSGNLYHGSRANKKGCHPDELLKADGYKTSSKIIKEIIDKEGLEAFEIINIEIFEDIKEAKLAEEDYHKKYDVRGNVYYFNQHNAGQKFNTTGIKCSEETKAKISKSNTGKSIGKGENHPNYGRKHNEETCLKMSISRMGDKNPNYGKTHSPETRSKISEANKGITVSEETLLKYKICNGGENNPMYGRTHSEETRKLMGERRKQKALERGPQPIIECPHCGFTSTSKSNMKVHHFDNCKEHPDYIAPPKEILFCQHCDKEFTLQCHLKVHEKRCFKNPLRKKRLKSPEVTCPHCSLQGSSNIMKRWHFDNCKHKVKDAA